MTESNNPSWPWPLSLLAGIVGAVMTPLGVNAGMLILAACGCYIGMIFAPSMSWIRAMLVFMGASVICAKAGTVLGAVLVLLQPQIAAAGDLPGLIAASLGLLFHPILATLAQRVPEAIAKRLSS